MGDQFARTRLVLGGEALEKLKNSHVVVFGVGGVGGYVCEALVRSGVGTIDIIDKDAVDETNLNRQIIALHSTLGRAKVHVMKERLLDINPEVTVNAHECFFLPENSHEFDFTQYDYVIDAVDTVTAKIEIIMKALEAGVRVISSMGTGNKLDAAHLKICDIYKTSVCPLAKVMRHELKKRGVKSLKVLCSDEQPVRSAAGRTPGSTAFVPAAAGLIIAGEVVRDLVSL